MGRKSYRTRTVTPRAEQPAAAPVQRPGPQTQGQGASPAPARRYTPRGGRTGPAKADFTDEAQYTHVRYDLLRIGLLALCLFGALILLRVATAAWGILP